MASPLTRRKTIKETLAATEEEGYRLRKDLGALDVTVFGIGVIIGAGIFVLTGVAAATKAGPAITLSFIVAALVCALAALCYAEFAAMVPAAGSAYTYSYATLGEFMAFIIGWQLVLELTVGAATVAIGWAGYLNATLEQLFGWRIPEVISHPPGDGGIINLPSIILVIFLTWVLVRGIKITARANIVMVAITVVVLLLVIVIGGQEIHVDNWTPYFPFGAKGVVSGAALVFFAFIGFDIIATMAEETRNPKRDMPIGILASLSFTTVLYVAVAAVITGMVAYSGLNSEAPVANAFVDLRFTWIAVVIFVGALVALTNTALIMILGQTRVAFAMARDHLIPRSMGKLHPKYETPYRVTIITGFVVLLLAGFTPIDVAAELVNIGTLVAFMFVAAGVIILRKVEPDVARPFKTPWVPVVPVLSIIASFVLVATLSPLTWVRFIVWMAIGLGVYFAYGRRASVVGHREDEKSTSSG